mgnify:CR=1 FL=1
MCHQGELSRQQPTATAEQATSAQQSLHQETLRRRVPHARQPTGERVRATDLPGGDYGTIERSIRERLYALPPDTRVVCGHGPDTTVGRERIHNPFVGKAAGY